MLTRRHAGRRPTVGGSSPVEGGSQAVTVAYLAYGAMESVRRLGRIQTGVGLQVGVEQVSDGDGDLVVDLPQGADHMGEPGELEGGGEVDGLVE